MEQDYRMTIGEFAKRVGYSVRTIQRWDKNGTLISKRTLTGRRYYLEADVILVLRGRSYD